MVKTRTRPSLAFPSRCFFFCDIRFFGKRTWSACQATCCFNREVRSGHANELLLDVAGLSSLRIHPVVHQCLAIVSTGPSHHHLIGWICTGVTLTGGTRLSLEVWRHACNLVAASSAGHCIEHVPCQQCMAICGNHLKSRNSGGGWPQVILLPTCAQHADSFGQKWLKKDGQTLQEQQTTAPMWPKTSKTFYWNMYLMVAWNDTLRDDQRLKNVQRRPICPLPLGLFQVQVAEGICFPCPTVFMSQVPPPLSNPCCSRWSEVAMASLPFPPWAARTLRTHGDMVPHRSPHHPPTGPSQLDQLRLCKLHLLPQYHRGSWNVS